MAEHRPPTAKLRIGSLFSGIGGLELGLERAGVGHVVFQCEIDPFCRQVLAKHWPNVERFEDVTQPRDWPEVDLICGGFPCQDVSAAGLGAGLAGARSGLWRYFADIVARVQPWIVVVENVASGKSRWLRQVRHDLHVRGYGTAAYAVSAADVGAPHLRRRVFVVANRDQARREGAGPEAHAEGCGPAAGTWWASEPDVARVVHGLRGGLDGRKRRNRIRALGNAVVPQCAEVIGRVILASEVRHAA
jgi:DNA (cytosine-5)-methyltransferase 1